MISWRAFLHKNFGFHQMRSWNRIIFFFVIIMNNTLRTIHFHKSWIQKRRLSLVVHRTANWLTCIFQHLVCKMNSWFFWAILSGFLNSLISVFFLELYICIKKRFQLKFLQIIILNNFFTCFLSNYNSIFLELTASFDLTFILIWFIFIFHYRHNLAHLWILIS